MEAVKPFVRNGKYLVDKVPAGPNLHASTKKAVDLIGGLDQEHLHLG